MGVTFRRVPSSRATSCRSVTAIRGDHQIELVELRDSSDQEPEFESSIDSLEQLVNQQLENSHQPSSNSYNHTSLAALPTLASEPAEVTSEQGVAAPGESPFATIAHIRQRSRRLVHRLRAMRVESWQLQDDLRSLSVQNQATTVERDARAAELQLLQSTLEERESQYASEIDRLIGELSTAYDSSNAIEQSLQESETRCQHYCAEIDRLAAELRQLQELLTRNEVHADQLLSTIAEREHQFADLQQKLLAAQDTIHAAETQLADHLACQESLRTELAALRAERDQQLIFQESFAQESQAQLERIQALQAELESAVARWQQAQAEVACLRSDQEAAESQQAQLEIQLSTTSSQLAEQAQTQDLLDSALQEVASLAVTVEKLTGDLQQAQSEVAQTLQESVRTQERCDQYAIAHEELTEKSDQQRQRIELLEIDFKSTNSEWQQALAQVTKLRGAVSAAEVQIESLETQLAAATSNSLEAGPSQVAVADQDTLAALHSQLAQREQDLAQREQELTQSLEKIAAFDQQVWQLSSDLASTQQQLTTCAEQGAQLNEVYQQTLLELENARASVPVAAEAFAPVEETVLPIENHFDSYLATDVPASEVIVSEANESEVSEFEEPHTVAVEDSPADLAEPNPEISTWVSSFQTPDSEPSDPVEDIVQEPTTTEEPLSSTASSEPEQPAPEFQPTSFIDQYSHIFEDSDSQSVTAGSSWPEGPTTEKVVDTFPPEQSDDESLQMYMSNLMRRVRGESSSETITPPVGKDLDAPSDHESYDPLERMNLLTKRVSTPTNSIEAGLLELVDLEQIRNTSKKPQLPTDLSAMRELANSSARQAIAKHRRRQTSESVLSKILVSGIAGSVSTYMLFTAESVGSPLALGGMAVGVVSVLWGFKLLKLLLEMIRDGRSHHRTPAELNISDEPLPIDG